MNIQQFDYTVNLSPAILWQYDEATRLKSLINQKSDWYDLNHTQFWQQWFNTVFSVLSVIPTDLLPVHQLGLIVWSIILNQTLQIQGTTNAIHTFGFNFGGTYSPDISWNQNFYYSNFPGDGAPSLLELTHQQLVLRLRYFNLTTRGDVLSINACLARVFPGVDGFSGSVFVRDPGNMTIIYIFTGDLSQTLKNILIKFDILPRPAAVGVKIWSNLGKIFGFGSFNQNFNNGCFMTDQ